ncbi:MAG: sigma 54-interacting transcriptional regulator [Bryobacteraceae bacterium]
MASFQTALVELARDESVDLSHCLEKICSVGASVLDVARTSVWLFNDSQSELVCKHLYDRQNNLHNRGAVLDIAQYPHYFEALQKARTIAASDASTHPATAEFAFGYLDTLGLASMLDVPVRREGRVIGVVCFEHAGSIRPWSDEEQSFAGSLADLVTLALETDRRLRYTQRLKILRQTDRAILSAGSASEIAQAALAGFQELVPCKRLSIALFEGGTGAATLIGVVSDQPTALASGSKLERGSFGDLDNLRQGIPYLVPDLGKLNRTESLAALESDRIQAIASIPLRALGRLVGTLNLGYEEVNGFTAEHIEIAQEVADSLAVAIHQARLNQEIQSHAEVLEQRVAARTAELRESEERLRSLYDNTPVMMHSLDEAGRIIEINQFWLDNLGYRRSEVIGRPVLEFTSPEFRDAVQNVIIPRLARDGFIRDVEVQGVKKNGDLIDLIASSVVRRDAHGLFLHSQTFMVDVTEQRRAQRENFYLQEQLQSELNFEEIVGSAPVMQRIFSSIEMVAPTDSTVLLLGETGTGKELIARALHNRSRRRQSVMVKLNCGALPANLVESELFGHEKGSFTGAVAQKKGRFELAHRGTMFLDEVGELPLETQTKLLRVLQEQEFERIGGSQTQKVDVRIIAATNRDLEQEIRRGVFRSDLFYRLNVFPIEVPPLRKRKEDIPVLASHFVSLFAQKMGRRIHGLHPSLTAQLVDYDWPGNVRELANLLERAVILCQGDTLQPQHLSVTRNRPLAAAGPEALPTLEEGERRLIQRALEQTGGILAGANGAAALLGINRSTLWSRMRKLGITS